ncbi:MAG: VOC family protein [Patescibacteria group bacterium]
MITKIDHINISVSDLEKATECFTELLNFQITHQGQLEGEWIDKVVGLENVKGRYVQLSIPNTETNLELIKYDTPSGEKEAKISLANQIGLRHLAFTVTNIEEIYGNLKKNGVKFFSEIQVYNKSKKLCYFLGPDGVILELSEYGNY